MNKNVKEYIDLLENFALDLIDAAQFEHKFLTLFRKYRDANIQFAEPYYVVLNDIFLDVDAFCADPTLRDDNDIDNCTLKLRCRKNLEKLNNL